MLKDPKAFFDAVRAHFGSLTESQVAGCNAIIAEGVKRKAPLNFTAQNLATSYWETGKTMAAVREAFYLGNKAEAYRKKLRYYPWYGRGHVQLTWKENYRKADEALGLNGALINNLDLALDPSISVQILWWGTTTGAFTGKDLDDYIDDIDESDDEDLREFANARRVVNGTDKQVEIGKIALAFEAALKAGGYTDEGGIIVDEEVVTLLQKGSEGRAVHDWQLALNRAGYHIDVDGEFADETDAATRAFQKANGIEIDGKVGDQTQEAMSLALSRGDMLADVMGQLMDVEGILEGIRDKLVA
jgi:hypothetical protein